MESHHKSSQNHFSNLINYASSVLKLSEQEIRDKFSDASICLMEYIEKGVHENIIEIRLDEECATLNCSFDKSNNCNSSFLFTDDMDDIDFYINYFNNTYDYDYIRGGWMLSNCYLSIKTIEKEICFMFYRPSKEN